jgi:hypothetical protein
MNALWALRGAHRHKDVESIVQDLRPFHGDILSLRAARVRDRLISRGHHGVKD